MPSVQRSATPFCSSSTWLFRITCRYFKSVDLGSTSLLTWNVLSLRNALVTWLRWPVVHLFITEVSPLPETVFAV